MDGWFYRELERRGRAIDRQICLFRVKNIDMIEKKGLKKKGLKKIASILIAAFLISCLCILSKANLFRINTVCLWILGGVYLTFIFYFGIFGCFVKTVTDRRTGIRYMIYAGVLSLLLIFFLPIRYGTVLKENLLDRFWYQGEGIVVESTKEKNENSLGYAVWIEGIVQDGKDFNLYEIPLSEGWRFEEGRIVSDAIEAEPLLLKLPEKNPYRIFFRKQEDAGCVRIRIGDFERVVDLYQKEYEQRFEMDWNDWVKLEVSFLGLKRLVFYGLEFCVLWIISLSAVAYFNNYYRKKWQRIRNYEKQE